MEILKVNIQLFGEGAGDSGSAGAAAVGETGDAVEGETSEADGGMEADEEALPEERDFEKRKKEYSDFKSKFKDEIRKETQAIVQDRLKKLKSENERQRFAIEKIGVKYGIMDGDIDAIIERMSGDKSMFAERAEEIGSTADNVERMFNLEMRNRRSEAELRRQAAEKQYINWQGQADEVRRTYDSGFDLDEAMSNNAEFRRLVVNNVPIKTAYEVLNRDKINQRVAKVTYDRTEKAVVDRIKARGVRPDENGSGSTSAKAVEFDPANLTKEQREDIRRRVKMGEKISF